MLRPALRWFGALGLGALAVAAVVRFVDDVFLGSGVGLCVTTGALLMLRIRREYPDRVTGDTWADKRWTGVSNGVVLFAALLGPTLSPVSEEYALALSVLALLTGLVGYLAGSLAEMDRDRVRSRDGTDRSSDGVTGD